MTSEIQSPAGEAPQFELGRELGAGAVGRVWHAVLSAPWRTWPAHTELAVKFLHPHLGADAVALGSFEIEAEVGRAVRHPSLVRHVFSGVHERGRFVAMEYVPGQTLREALLDKGEFPEPLARSIAAGLAGALAALHAAGFVHADVKPENIRLDARGRAVLMDLGFAQRGQAQQRARPAARGSTGAARPAPELAHAAGVNPGSLSYLSPERARGQPCVPASDVFALGVVLYELVTGHHAFATEDGEREAEIGASGFSSRRPLRQSLDLPGADRLLAAIANARYVPASRIVPQVSPLLDQLLQEMLRRNPGQRPSAAEIALRFEEGEAGAWWRSRVDLDQDARRTAFADGDDPHFLPLVGRDRERELLLAAYARAVQPDAEQRGNVVWLHGPSGAGKSRLVSDCASLARAGAQAPLYLYGRCSPFEEERPCAPILRLVERYLRLPSGVAPRRREKALLAELVSPALVATLSHALDPKSKGATQIAVPAALAEWIAALGARTPLFVFLDDVNFADEGTLETLARVGHELAAMRALFVLGVREHEETTHAEALARLRERLQAQVDALELRLEPLDEAAVQALTAQVFHHSSPRRRIGQVLWELSRGNPGLLAEILHGALARGDAHRAAGDDQKLVLAVPPDRLPLPQSLQNMIQERLDKLTLSERDFLLRLSVVGGRIEHDFLLRAFPELREVELDPLLARLVHTGWLVSVGDRYRFARPALREAIYRLLDDEQRERLHAQAAEALLARGDASAPATKSAERRISIADALQRAFHLRAAHRHEDLLRILRPLIAVLPRRGQTQRVYVLARWGLDALDALRVTRQRSRVRIEFLEAAADAADRLGYRVEQRQWLDHLSDMPFDATRDTEALARVYVLHGRYAVSTGQYGLARGMLRNAVELAEKAGSRQHSSEALRRLSAVQAHVGELGEARALVERAIEAAVHDPQRAVGWLQRAVIELLENDLEHALHSANQALALQRKARRWHLPGILAAGHMLRGRIYRVLGRPARALGSMQRAVTLARQAGERRLEMEATARLGGLLLDVDQPEEAEARLREALLIANEIEDRRGQTLAGLWLGTLLWEQSDPEAARLLARVSQLASEMGLSRAEALALSIRARIARAAGDVELALELSQHALDLIAHQGSELPDRIVVTGTHALVLHAAGRAPEAAELVKDLRRRMRKDNERLENDTLRQSHRVATTRLLEAVLSPQGVIYPRVELEASKG